MNWRNAYPIILCISIFTILLAPQNAASAQGLSFVDIPLEAFHADQSIELHGLISSQALNIPIPESWLPVEENWIEIQIRASPVLDTASSSITVSLNDQLLFSSRLSEVKTSRQRLPIRAGMLMKGNNTLNITSTLYLPEDQLTNCQNWDDPARWLVVEPGGIFHLSFERENAQIDLASFPQGFIEPLEAYLSQDSRQRTLFVLPEVTTTDDLTSLSTISYVLGSYAGRIEDWQPEITSETQFTDRSATHRNVIFIGHVPKQIQVESDHNQDFIALSPSPWGIGNAVIIIGDRNRQDGFTPASIFSDRTRRLLLQGNLAYVRPQPIPAPQPFLHDFTFEDIGYLDRTVKGIGPQSLIYRLYIPYEVDPVQIQFHLRLLHSSNLDLNNSSFTLYLNGFSVAGILPDPLDSAGEPVTVGLPARRLKPGVNYLRINFDLHIVQGSCERAPESVWATVLNTSNFEVSYRNHTPTPSLEYFPLPFSDPPGSLLVLPDQFHQQDLANVSKLSFMMGSLTGPDSDPPEVMTASSFLPNKSQYRNIILIGLPAENPITLAANDMLPQPFSEDGRSLQDGYGVALPTTDRQASLGLLQILPSPWVRGGTILVVTGNDPKGLEWTWDALLDPTLRDQFAGNLMVVGSDHRSQTSDGLGTEPSLQTLFQQIADAGNIPIVGSLLQRYGPGFIGPTTAAVGSALLLCIATWWVLRVIRKRNASAPVRKEDESEEHE